MASAALRVYGEERTPPKSAVLGSCSRCGISVRVRVTREFVNALRRLSKLAGAPLAKNIPALTYQCDRGHIVVISVEQLGLLPEA